MAAQKYNLFFLFPNNFGMIFVEVEFSCQDEEVVAEAVDVGYQAGTDGFLLLVQAQDAAFGTSADCAADVADG